MKKLVAAFVCLGLLAGMATAQSNIQLFFSESNTDPGAAAGNPIVDATGGPVTQTLYLWSAFNPATDIWNGLGLFVETTGDVVADMGSTYQVSYFSGAFSRWQTSPAQPYNPEWAMGARGLGHNAAAVTSQGLNNPFDAALKTPAGFLLVGEITFTGQNGDIFLGVGDGKITRRDGNPGADTVTFGAGDPPVIANVPGTVSASFDAQFIPEPASLLLLGLAGLALRRR